MHWIKLTITSEWNPTETPSSIQSIRCYLCGNEWVLKYWRIFHKLSSLSKYWAWRVVNMALNLYKSQAFAHTSMSVWCNPMCPHTYDDDLAFVPELLDMDMWRRLLSILISLRMINTQSFPEIRTEKVQVKHSFFGLEFGICVFTHHLCINRNLSIFIVFIFHFFIRHKLNSTMTDTEHSGNETL